MAGEDSTTGHQRQRHAMAGTLIMAGLAACALLTFFLDDILATFRAEYTVYAVIDATGLPAGAPVWVNGRPVGTVTAVGVLNSDSDSLPRAVLTLQLPASAQPHVRGDSRVRITSSNLTTMISARVVDITAGTTAAPALAPGDTLLHMHRPAPRHSMQRMALVARSADSTVAELRSQSGAVRQQAMQTQRAFTEFEAMVAGLGRIQAEIDSGAGLAALRDPALRTSLSNVRGHARELASLAGSMGGFASDSSDAQAAVSRITARVDSLGRRLAQMDTLLDNPNATLARIRQDGALARSIRDARVQIDSLLADIRRNPFRFAF